MSIEGVEAFWEEVDKSSDRLKESFQARPDEELSVPKIYVVPTQK